MVFVSNPRRSLLRRPLWTPISLGSALVAWWDAQKTSTIVFNGSNVSAWTDMRSGIAASQATGGNQPTWSATAQNGKAGLTFNGTTQVLKGTGIGFPQGTSLTISVAGIGNNGPFFEYGTTTNTNTAYLYSFGNNARGVIAGANTQSGVNWTSNNRFVQLINTAGSGILWVDGVNSGTAAFGATVPTGQNFAIGGSVTGSLFLTGTVQQVVVVSTALTTFQQQCLEGWESWYNGKAGTNLPSAHPYKSSPP
jgi:hypothetical protein